METSTGMGTTKVVIVGILGFLVGFGVSYLWLSGKLSVRTSVTAPSAQEGGGVARETPGKEATPKTPEQGMTTGGDGSDVAAKIQATPQEVKTKSAATPGVVAGNSVSVSDQAPGSTVTVASVSMDKRGWVVIHQDDHGAPGWVLGAHRLTPGSYTNEVVDLLRASVPGSVYYAMLHSDDGVDTFDLHKDLPITDGVGNPVMMRFKTTGQ